MKHLLLLIMALAISCVSYGQKRTPRYNYNENPPVTFDPSVESTEKGVLGGKRITWTCYRFTEPSCGSCEDGRMQGKITWNGKTYKATGSYDYHTKYYNLFYNKKYVGKISISYNNAGDYRYRVGIVATINGKRYTGHAN